MNKKHLQVLAAAVLLLAFNSAPAMAAKYYEEQTNFAEDTVPLANYRWDNERIRGCIFKESDVPNSFYVWAKLAVQSWRQALREYTDNQQGWSITARYVRTEAQLESCDIKFYIYDSYKDFPDHPEQTGAYALVKHEGRIAKSASVYLAPLILHGDGATEINIPSYAFRNSAVHEVGHVLGLGHMQSEKGYLMSPQFDYFEESDQLSITTLELGSLVRIYGGDGFD